MNPHEAAGWMFMFACFAGAMFTMHRRKPSSFFCPRCGNPSVMHKRDCPEAQ